MRWLNPTPDSNLAIDLRPLSRQLEPSGDDDEEEEGSNGLDRVESQLSHGGQSTTTTSYYGYGLGAPRVPFLLQVRSSWFESPPPPFSTFSLWGNFPAGAVSAAQPASQQQQQQQEQFHHTSTQPNTNSQPAAASASRKRGQSHDLSFDAATNSYAAQYEE